ncbi:MAG: hypothetical protein ACOVQM_10765 [Pirellula sp.]|jgi:hypothetical protein
MNLRISLCILVVACMLAAGCNMETGRIAVSGSVSLDGKPIHDCIAVFQPIDSRGSQWGATAVVSQGWLELPARNGLVPGQYGVIFTENQPDLEDYEALRLSGSKNPLNKKFIPTRYTVPNDLRITIENGMAPISLSLKSK